MVIRSALFNIAFILVTCVIGFFGLPFSFASRRYAVCVAQAWTYTTIWLLKVICGITYDIRGRENLPQGPVLIASKHQSAWDTVIYWMLLKRPVFVLKRELIFIPIFGWQLLLLGSIYIDRKAGASAMKRMLREAKARVADHSSIIIFPEGTRTVPGTVNTYHPGVAALYQSLNIPVVPVALNSGQHWGKKAFVKKPGVIVLEFLPPIAPGMKGRDFLPLLQERIETASDALLQ